MASELLTKYHRNRIVAGEEGYRLEEWNKVGHYKRDSAVVFVIEQNRKELTIKMNSGKDGGKTIYFSVKDVLGRSFSFGGKVAILWASEWRETISTLWVAKVVDDEQEKLG